MELKPAAAAPRGTLFLLLVVGCDVLVSLLLLRVNLGNEK